MGLIQNLKLLFSPSLLSRMTELETAQDLLEEWVEGRLDSMKQYSARVAKRDRDRARQGDDREDSNGSTPPLHPNPRIAALLRRRAARGNRGVANSSLPG